MPSFTFRQRVSNRGPKRPSKKANSPNATTPTISFLVALTVGLKHNLGHPDPSVFWPTMFDELREVHAKSVNVTHSNPNKVNLPRLGSD